MMTTPAVPPPSRARQISLAAWCVWMGFILILTVVTGRKTMEGKNSVVPDYRAAAVAWLHAEPIYDLKDANGFLYLPASAVLTVPLAVLPPAVHEFAFRWISILALAYSLLRLSQALRDRFGENIFLIVTLCVLPAAAGPARAGQMNLLLAATMTLAAADAMSERWTRSAFWLGLGFALKPQAIVLAALMTVLWPKLRLRGTLALAAALALPFLFQSPAYVIEQCHLCIQKLTLTGRPGEEGANFKDFNDLTGLLGALGVTLSENLRWAIRLAAAALTLAACALARRRSGPKESLLLTLGFAAAYLMLFNPRTEGGSYVIAAVPLAAYAAWDMLRKHFAAASGLVLIALVWGFSYDLSNALWQLAHAMGMIAKTATFRTGYGPYWLSPLLAIFFLAYLIYKLAAPRNAIAVTAAAPTPAQTRAR